MLNINIILKKMKEKWDLIFLLLIFLYGLLSIKTIFSDGIIPGWDNPVHLYHSYITARYFLPKLNILGWDPWNYYGWCFNQYYNPGAYLFVSIVYYLSLGYFDINTSYKIAFLLTYLLPALSIFLYTRFLLNDKISSLVSAFFSLTVFNEEIPFIDAGLKQMYIVGMWPHRLGLALALMGTALQVYIFRKSDNKEKNILISLWMGLLLTYTLLVHTMMAIAFGLLLVLHYILLLFFYEKRKNVSVVKIVSLPLTLVIAFFSSLFWSLPLLETNDKYNNLPTITWHIGPRLFLYASSINILLWFFIIIAIFSTLIQPKNSGKKSINITIILSLLIVHLLSFINLNDGYLGFRLLSLAFISLIGLYYSQDLIYIILLSTYVLLFLGCGPETYKIQFLFTTIDLTKIIPLATKLGYAKFGAVAKMLLLNISGIGLGRIVNKTIEYFSKKKTKRNIYLLFFIIVIFLFNYFIDIQAKNTDLDYPFSGEKKFKLDKDYKDTSNLLSIISWIEKNIKDNNTYILMQDTLYRLGDWKNLPVSHYFAITPMYTKKPIIGSIFGTRYITDPITNTETNTMLGFPIARLAFDEKLIISLTKELGISYIETFDKNLIKGLNNSNSFILVYKKDRIHLFKSRKKRNIITLDDGQINNVLIEPNRITFTVNAENYSYIKIRMIKYPGWKAYIDGKETEIKEYNPILPTIVKLGGQIFYNYKVPFIKTRIKPGKHFVELRFERHTVGELATLIVILAISIYTIFYARHFVYVLGTILYKKFH